MLEIYGNIIAVLTGSVTLANAPVSAYHLIIDHALTITLVLIAIKTVKSAHATMSAKIAVSLLAGSYIISSVDYYFFSFFSKPENYDYTVYLSYTFLDSLTILLIIFGHMFIKERFSFAANVVCIMMFASSITQFFATSLFLYAQSFTISDETYYFLGGLYSIALNVICWGGAYMIAFPVKAQIQYQQLKTLLMRNKEIAQ